MKLLLPLGNATVLENKQIKLKGKGNVPVLNSLSTTP
jgi:hypothetical protein